MLAAVDWRAVFWVNVPVIILIAVTYGIQPSGGHTMGWTSPWVLGGLAVGLALLGAFLLVEQRIEEPMFELGLFRNRAFAPATPPGRSSRSRAAGSSSC